MEEDVGVFLEHFGIKGMRWGVRNDKKPLTTQERKRRNQRRANIAVSGVFLAFGAAKIASVLLEVTGHRKMSGIPKTPTKSAEDLIHSQFDTQMYSLKRMHEEGKMDAEQFKTFSKTLSDRYARKLTEV